MVVVNVVVTAFWVWMIIDFFQRSSIDEGFWTLLVFCTPIGAVIYFFGSYLPHAQTASGTAIKGRRLKELLATGEDRLPAGELRELGDLYRQRGKWAEAVRCYQRALTAFPDQHSLRLETARCLWQLGQAEQAIPELRQVVDKAPHYRKDAAALLSECLVERANWSEALPELKSLAQLASSIEPSYYYGLALLNTKQMQEARAIFEEIVRQGPSLDRSHRRFAHRAQSLLRQCQKKEK